MAKFIQTKNGHLLNVDQIAKISIFEQVDAAVNPETQEVTSKSTGVYKVRAFTVAGWTTLVDCASKEEAEKQLASFYNGPITVPVGAMVN